MKPKTALTTGQIAAHCQVASETVVNWIKSGQIRAYTTGGGHHRVLLEDFRVFAQAHDIPPLAEEQSAKWKILVVDDEPDVVSTVVRLLRKSAEHEIATAIDGFGAGLQIERFCPDLVILDLMMPQLDGFQVCKLLKSTPETAHIKVLVLTGFASDENVRRAVECGADTWMAKPIKGRELRERVGTLLAGKGYSSNTNLQSAEY